MLASVSSAAVLGVDAFEVRVEADVANGLPNFLIVGLPDTAVQESRERVRAALQNSELPYPLRRVVVNLAPADVRKEGPAFDLPIALALLAAQRALPPAALARTVVVGELALDGTIRPVRGALSVALLAARAGGQRAIVPAGNAAEAALADDLEVIAAPDLRQLVAFLQGRQELAAARPAPRPPRPAEPDLAEVRGQAAAKRALEITAAGGHNLLMTGPPGTGKTMLAERLPGLLPDLTREEALEVTRVHSTAGRSFSGLVERPPFRAPHHTVTPAGLVGGGAIPRPGEVSLAHRGVLFLDELPEFGRRSLELLRQPLEAGTLTLSRARLAVTFPARFVLVASRNPCPCGYYQDDARPCSCPPPLRHRYEERLSGPLLDRFDLRITVPRLPAPDLLRAAPGEPSAAVRARVEAARATALDRQGAPNAQLAGRALRLHARLGAGQEAFARHAIRQLRLSGRGFDRLLRVARTIADLAGAGRIGEDHLAEAAGYRGG